MSKKSITRFKELNKFWRLTLAVSASALLVFTFSFGSSQSGSALSNAELRQKSRELQAQIDANRAKANELSQQADSLQRKLAEIDVQIQEVDAQIRLIDIKLEELQNQLEETQRELERQKGLLKASMRALYKKQGASTVELLVGSDTFSQYIDQQEYLDRLKTNIQTSTEQVIQLKHQIEKQQIEQKTLLEAQKGQRQTLAAKKDEQRVLLETTRGQEANYSAAVEELRRQQAAINAQLVPSGTVDYTSTTSYPWAGYQPWSFNSCKVDPWGMCVRQCVSYTAWKVAQSGRHMPYWGGHGNANQWDDNARAAGIPVDSNPRPGDIAVSNAGFYGHVMYVESVLADGRIHVSQYNYELQGRYSEMVISRGSLVFIHF